MAGAAPRAARFTAAALAAALAIATGLQDQFEGKKYVAYYDGAGVLTVGQGHTGPDVLKGKVYTQGEVDAFAVADRLKAQAAVLPGLTRVIPDGCLGSAQDFALNVGAGAFRTSTILKKFNAGDFVGAANEFPKWHFIHRGDQVIDCRTKQPWCAGIPPRREAERQACLRSIETPAQPADRPKEAA